MQDSRARLPFDQENYSNVFRRKLELGNNIWFDRLRFLSHLGLSDKNYLENEKVKSFEKTFEYKTEYFERKFHWTI